MAITSTGYVGTIMENGPWAVAQGPLGGEYFAESFNAGRVTALGSSARTVRVGNGVIGGHGITDTLSGTNDITLTNPASGTVWYPIYARRTWQTTQATTLVAGAAVTSANTLPSRNTSKGTIDDQPLALVQVQKDNPTILNVIDLRAVGWGKGFFVAYDDRVLQYMTKVGYRILIGDSEWTRVAPGGVETWSKMSASGRVLAELPYIRVTRDTPFSNPINTGTSQNFYAGQSATTLGASAFTFSHGAISQPGSAATPARIVFTEDGSYAVGCRLDVDVAVGASVTLNLSLPASDSATGARTRVYVPNSIATELTLTDTRFIKAGKAWTPRFNSSQPVLVRSWSMWATRIG